MFCFAALCCAVFVPPSLTSSVKLREFDEESFKSFSPARETVTALVVSDYCPLVDDFAKMATLFAGRSDFCFFRARNCPRMLRAVYAKPPALLFFYKGKLAFASKLDGSKEGLLAQISEWLAPSGEIAQTKNELFAKLGGADRTLIVRGETGARGTMLVSGILPYSGPCKVARASDHVFEELGLGDSDLAMFRRKDNTLLPVRENTSELYQATIPFVSKVTVEETQMTNLLAVMVDKEFDEHKHSGLYALGEKYYKDFRFGVLYSDNFAVLKQLNITTTVPNFVVLSIISGFHYPSGPLEGKSFDDDDWQELADAYLKKIINQETPRQYLSEEPDASAGPVEKVVGATYQQFVSDTEHDVVMFYHQSRPQDNMTMAEFQEVAAGVVANGTTSIKFGSIDTTLNSCEMRYPFMLSVPMVQIFPAKNKSSSRPMFGQPTRDSFLRFLKRYASIPVSWEAPEISFEEAAMEQMTLGMKLNVARLPSPLHEYAISYMEELEVILNSTRIRLDPQPEL